MSNKKMTMRESDNCYPQRSKCAALAQRVSVRLSRSGAATTTSWRLYLGITQTPWFLLVTHIAAPQRPYQKLAFVRALWRSYARYHKIMTV